MGFLSFFKLTNSEIYSIVGRNEFTQKFKCIKAGI
jgi:hypothetical protein